MPLNKAASIDRPDLLEDLLGLYELSLSVGQHLEARATVRSFLKTLIARRNLTGAAIWWKEAEGGAFSLLDALPRNQASDGILCTPHPLWQRSLDGRVSVLPLSSPALATEMPGISANDRVLAIYPLGSDGILLMRSADEGAFSERKLNQMRAVLNKLSNAIQGGLAYERLKRSEAALKARSEQLKQAASVFAHADEGIMITDPFGIILDVNPAFTEITGYDREEVIGRTPRLLNSGRQDDAFYRAMWQTLIREGRYSGELWNRRKDGTRFVSRQTISAVRNQEGELVRYVCLFSDHTILKEQQHALQQLVESRTHDLSLAKEAAEAASRAKSIFLANMSHELRTPMNGVLGMISLAKRRVDNPEVTGLLQKGEASAQRLLGVLNDILDLSKIEAEQLALECIPFSLGQVNENLLTLFSHKADEKGLALRIGLAAGLESCQFLGDPLRLGQVLINLVGNAIKFSSAGTVAVNIQARHQEAGQALLYFEVSDAGIGISESDQQRLFVAFEQADGSMTRKFGGTGLGLAISKHLVELMGGEIGVVSQPGIGSTFWFTARFPCEAAPATVAIEPELTAVEQQLRQRHAGARVLVVEDEPIGSEILSMLLAEVGLTVATAEDGLIALDLARQAEFDLIIMDMQMPRMNGLDATRAIRADSLNRAIPILAMTANAFEHDRQLCIEAGMNDHLAKPVIPEAMYASILNWLGTMDRG